MRLRFVFLSVVVLCFCVPCLAQQQDTSPAPDVFPDRPVNWIKLVPNLAHDQKDIWSFPVSRSIVRHDKPVLALTAITALTVATVDVPSGKYFQRTQSFYGFNRKFSGLNTSIAMFAAPSVFYGVSLLRRSSYDQRTFLLAGEAVLDSEALTTVMKDVDRRMKPSEVPLNGDFGDTWFNSHAGSIGRGIGSFPSGHTIAAFSLATVFADRYPGHRWNAWVAYGLASAVGFSRISLQSHHPSDVLAGAALGYTIAHYGVLHAR
jgi:PAP2 superfamily